MTAWHLGWQERFPEHMREVTIGPHRADVKTSKCVIEFQHSPISVEDIQAREAFYGNMVWVFDWPRVTIYGDNVVMDAMGPPYTNHKHMFDRDAYLAILDRASETLSRITKTLFLDTGDNLFRCTSPNRLFRTSSGKCWWGHFVSVEDFILEHV
jgi:hypothetical protein